MRTQGIRCLIDGCSIRATVRITGIAKKTVMRLLCEVGDVCADYQDRVFRNLRCKRLQLDECWSWVYCKQKNRTEDIAREHPDAGDVWLWVCMDADTKFVPTWTLGARDTLTAWAFVEDTAKRVSGRIQVTTDAFKVYLNVIEEVFGLSIDYATLQKVFGASDEPEKRYCPAKCIGCDMKPVIGDPYPKHVRTSFVERQNWSLRTSVRRMTRLSNGFFARQAIMPRRSR